MIGINIHPEENEERTDKIAHRTDTDTDIRNQRKKYHHNEDSKISKAIKKQEGKSKKQTRNAFGQFIEKLPSYEYDIPKKTKNQRKNNDLIELYPINDRETDNNRFFNYNEAFLYIAKHCQKYHNRYTREVCRKYLQNCYIIDFCQDGFVPILSNLSQKDFNKYFQNSQRELKFM